MRNALAVALVVSLASMCRASWISPLWNISGTSVSVSTDVDFLAFGYADNVLSVGIMSVDPATGSVRWTANMSSSSSSYSFSPQTFLCDVEPSIIFAVVAGSPQGAYMALDRSSGEVLWTLPQPLEFADNAQWQCPKVRGDPLLILTRNTNNVTLASVDTQSGKQYFQNLVNTTAPVQLLIVERCGPHEAFRCVVIQDLQGTHILNVVTGERVHHFNAAVFWEPLASAKNLLLVGANNGVEAWTWNGTVVWSVPNTQYNGGNSQFWMYSYNSAVAYSTLTGQVLWNWTDACAAIYSPPPGDDMPCDLNLNFALNVPLASTTCGYGNGCSAAAFDPTTGVVQWHIVNHTLSYTPAQRSAFTTFGSSVNATVIRVSTGEQRQAKLTAYPEVVTGLGATDSILILQTNDMMWGFNRF